MIKQQIENIIKKNLPEEIDTSKLEPLEEKIFANGINYLLKQIDISLASLIADEVRKFMVEKIKKINVSGGGNGRRLKEQIIYLIKEDK